MLSPRGRPWGFISTLKIRNTRLHSGLEQPMIATEAQWATRSSTRSFTHTAHLLACFLARPCAPLGYAALGCAPLCCNALTHMFACSLFRSLPSLSECLIFADPCSGYFGIRTNGDCWCWAKGTGTSGRQWGGGEKAFLPFFRFLVNCIRGPLFHKSQYLRFTGCFSSTKPQICLRPSRVVPSSPCVRACVLRCNGTSVCARFCVCARVLSEESKPVLFKKKHVTER